MAMHTGDGSSLNGLRLWWARRLEQRRAIELAVIDLRERYGAAAHAIARNSARRGGAASRRFWQRVARRLRGKRLAPDTP